MAKDQPLYEARAWSSHAKTTVGRTVNGQFQPVAECSGFGNTSAEAERMAAKIVDALTLLDSGIDAALDEMGAP
jgi:hypothetical protein